ncbi:MAG TPA: substrate-binding domain-containing protein [Vicinamibacterales bacterium]|nr:substrate-binding domain-containing protein [Vicinamibacterales bacterium]
MRCLLSLVLALGIASQAYGEDLRVYAAAAVRSPLLILAADYEAKTGNTVVVVFDTAGATVERFRADPNATLLITTDAVLSQRESSGALKGGVRNQLGTTDAGIAVPPGSPKPDISSAATLKAALLAAQRIAFSDPARGATVGTHFMTVIETLGIKDEVLKKAVIAPDGVETMRLVLDRTADLGISQTSEIVQANPDALVGPFPREFSLATTFSLWYPVSISPAAIDFVTLIASPASRARLKTEGFR